MRRAARLGLRITLSFLVVVATAGVAGALRDGFAPLAAPPKAAKLPPIALDDPLAQCGADVLLYAATLAATRMVICERAAGLAARADLLEADLRQRGFRARRTTGPDGSVWFGASRDDAQIDLYLSPSGTTAGIIEVVQLQTTPRGR